ncbi:hypothetical protein ASG31_00590 [Chryseobacterium sp. Leaf404]|uniref:hypothetical protein n=1 Tax=unclassified Chryseobacterium TaxID=2593645 RepID=UPI0006FC7D53|nr:MULTISPECIES: hypothetical protein [unclassified Chryseobacterium]KQT21876.1 hypothetical protein ASG31_00590 [Chryseobacterium sp. Leaf404]
MKKILLGFALGFATLSMAQQYPDYGYGNNGYSDGYYSDEDDQNYFPDDYYYNYPQDYYPQDYYQSYYNDYRNSVININWNVFFRQNRLSRWQIDQILYLNSLYSNFATWNNFYGYNPDRWYYDRFYALERIMGPRVFVVFQNNYYRGNAPIVYFQNYRRSYYTPRFRVTPRYRNVNINIYRVNRVDFRRTENPTLNAVRGSSFRNNSESGFRGNSGNSGTRNPNGGFRDNNNSGTRPGNGGFRNGSESQPRSNGGFRNESSTQPRSNGGFRNENSSPRAESPSPRGGGFRGGNGEVKRDEPTRSGGGFRNGGEARPQRNEAPSGRGNSGGGERSGGFRTRLAGN